METTAVLDLGSETLKIGYAANVPSEEEPRVVLPSCVKLKDGEACWAVQHGQPANWEAVETLLYHALYNKLGWIIGSEGMLVLVEPLMLPKPDREQLIQILFETFNCNGLYIQDAAALSLYAVGKQAGIAVDIGHGKIDIASVSEGVTNAANAVRLDFNGADLTAHLQQQLASDPSNPQQLSTAQAQALKCLCSKAAPTAAAFDDPAAAAAAAASELPPAAEAAAAAAAAGASNSSSEPQAYTLPDGTSITVTQQQAQSVAEALLRPTVLGLQCPGLPHVISDAALSHADISSKRQLLENIHLVGGGATIPGLGERVMHEVKELANVNFAPGLALVPEYMPRNASKYAAWLGGAVVARVVQGQQHYALKEDYDEAGPCGVSKRCC